MNDRTLLKVGIIGSIVAALCCFTPLLVAAFAALGLSALVGWLDYLLLPVLALFLGLATFALVRRRKTP